MTAQPALDWIDIGKLSDVPRRGARVIKTPKGCVAVFRTEDDSVYALKDRCPHKGGPLSQGIVHGHLVTCPLHNMVFDLNTGLAQGADQGQVPTYDIRVERGRLMLHASFLTLGEAH